VPGLAAKPIIDLDVVIPSRRDLPMAVTQLGRLGYEHRGDLGIKGRDAFRTPETEAAQRLYVCPQDSLALRNHITLRDHLRPHSADVVAYSILKKQLAERCAGDFTASFCQFLRNMVSVPIPWI
jgi:GrpB-like predicted nucleotidyltransferase (UPF0157 family)